MYYNIYIYIYIYTVQNDTIQYRLLNMETSMHVANLMHNLICVCDAD